MHLNHRFANRSLCQLIHALALSVLVSVAACTAEGGKGRPNGATTSSKLTLVDSVVLSEPDSAPLAQPVETMVSGENIFVADQAARRVRRYSRSGQLTATYGQPGRGPGEFEAPFRMALLDDSTLAITERAKSVISLFDLRTGNHRGDIPHEGMVYGLDASEGRLIVGAVRARGWTPLGHWEAGMDSVAPYGTMPTYLVDVPTLPPMKWSVAVAATPQGSAVLFSNADTVYVYDRSRSLTAKVSIPATARRGVPRDAEIRSINARTQAARYNILSTAAAMQLLSTGDWAAVHFDFNLVGRRLTAVAWLSVTGADGESKCAETRLPLSDDAMPNARFSGDTLFTLDQYVADGGVKTIVRGWVIDAAGCGQVR